MRDKIIAAIRGKLRAFVECDLSLDDIAIEIADDIIEDEIGDLEEAAKEYITDQASDWAGKFDSLDILHDEIDRII